MKTIQASGKTLDGAVENALQQLGLNRDQVEVKVLQEGGFLRNFKVEVTQILTPAQKIQEFLQNIITKMGVADGVVELGQSDDAILLNIKCENTGNVIGYRGETLDALQYLCSLMLNEKSSGFKRVILDCEGYRQKREKTLKKLAGNIEQKVKRTGVAVSLEPMNPYERRIIHTALQNSKHVTTESEGQGVNRHIVVSPKEQSNILNSLNAPRKTLNFVYRSEKKTRRERKQKAYNQKEPCKKQGSFFTPIYSMQLLHDCLKDNVTNAILVFATLCVFTRLYFR